MQASMGMLLLSAYWIPWAINTEKLELAICFILQADK